jgi:hypothetical protein
MRTHPSSGRRLLVELGGAVVVASGRAQPPEIGCRRRQRGRRRRAGLAILRLTTAPPRAHALGVAAVTAALAPGEAAAHLPVFS